ncbi:MAG: hypothetical protein VB852_07530, partial [Deltaproteobacteria bacterium]
TSALTVNRSAEGLPWAVLSHGLFGRDLDTAIRPGSEAGKTHANCQKKALKSAFKLYDKDIKSWNKAVAKLISDKGFSVGGGTKLYARSNGDLRNCLDTQCYDPKAKIDKLANKVLTAFAGKHCTGVDLADAFPATCKDTPTLEAMASCMAARTRQAARDYMAAVAGLD